MRPYDELIGGIVTNLPSIPYWRGLSESCKTAEQWHGWKWSSSFMYRRLVRDFAELLGITDYLYQAEPNLRILPTGDTCVPWHTDADFGHLEAEWNVWIPLTEIEEPTQALWVQSPKGHRCPVECQLGEAFIFAGARITHGNMINLGTERRSMDFRIMPKEAYVGTAARTVRYGVPMTIGNYWKEEA